MIFRKRKPQNTTQSPIVSQISGPYLAIENHENFLLCTLRSYNPLRTHPPSPLWIPLLHVQIKTRGSGGIHQEIPEQRVYLIQLISCRSCTIIGTESVRKSKAMCSLPRTQCHHGKKSIPLATFFEVINKT